MARRIGEDPDEARELGFARRAMLTLSLCGDKPEACDTDEMPE